jgi:hypothetical protein
MEYRKTILKTVLFTTLSLFVTLLIVIALMYFVFTLSFANLMYNIGCDNWASSLYYKVYEKTDDINYCYKALNIKISIDDSDKVIAYYENFVADEDCQEFLDSVKENSEKLNIGKLEKSTLLNDRNYLVGNYVKALVEEGRCDDAWGIAMSELSYYENFTLRDQGVYAISPWIANEEWQKFNEIQGCFDEVLVVELQNYFDFSYNLFCGNQATDNVIDQAYLIALGNRVITIGQDINRICNGLNVSSAEIASNLEKMVAVNNIIKGLV